MSIAFIAKVGNVSIWWNLLSFCTLSDSRFEVVKAVWAYWHYASANSEEDEKD
jgi:hypothetical protein